MASWKKVIVSGSDAHLHHITASGCIFASGSTGTSGTGGHITASGNISASKFQAALATNYYIDGVAMLEYSSNTRVFGATDKNPRGGIGFI